VTSDRLRSPGGTSGGLGSFLLGLVMAVAGGYIFTSRVTVFSSSWDLFGINGYSLALVPLIFGIFILFFGKTLLGSLITGAGLIIILAAVISHMRFFFRSSLFDTIIIFILLFGGLGLVFRSLRAFTRD
jgi:hypothetical protein